MSFSTRAWSRPNQPLTERLRVMNRHFALMIETFGEVMGCVMFRKVGPWYAKRFGPASFFNKGIVRIAKHERLQKAGHRIPRLEAASSSMRTASSFSATPRPNYRSILSTRKNPLPYDANPYPGPRRTERDVVTQLRRCNASDYL